MSGLIDFETKKSVHVNLTKSVHSELRAMLVRRGLSMQEVFDKLASGIVENDPSLIEILDDLVLQKRDNSLKRFSKTDSDSIFDVIESSNPFEPGG